MHGVGLKENRQLFLEGCGLRSLKCDIHERKVWPCRDVIMCSPATNIHSATSNMLSFNTSELNVQHVVDN